jgi:hypothetical protein
VTGSDDQHLPPEEVAALEGTPPPEDQDAFLESGELEAADAPSDTEIYQGELEAIGGSAAGGLLVDELAMSGERPGETDDPNVAAEEGEPWIPPIDPPVVADASSPDGFTIAAGFAASALEEPFDADHHGSALQDDDEITARVREALLADARTSRLADAVDVENDGGVVTLWAIVEDIDDSDMLLEVASGVAGVVEVRDETEVKGF